MDRDNQRAAVLFATPGETAGPGTRVRRVDARRNLEAILEAARTILPERPEASMQEIAGAAGVHRATVHRHFAAREDLVTALRARAVGDFVNAAEDVAADAPADSAVAIEQLTTAVLTVIDHYRLYRFTTWRDEVTTARAADLLEPFRTLVAGAGGPGGIRDDVPPEQLYIAWMGLVGSLGPEIASGTLTTTDAAMLVRRLMTRA